VRVQEPEPERPDPYLWLEDVEGERALAWVRAHTEATRGALSDAAFEADRTLIRGILTRPSNIPYIGRRGERVYNFWQDETHVRGLWRRTSLESYREPEPDWETVIDLDALAAAEGEDWVWRGAASLEPEHRSALVSLSRGGADAVVIREFDLVEKRFVPDGFVLPEAKGSAHFVDADELLIRTTLGEGAATASGYPRQVRRWRRGLPFAEAPVVFEGTVGDIAAGVSVDREPGFERTFFTRQLTFEESRSWLAGEEGSLTEVDLPTDADWEVAREWLFVQLKSDWTPAGRTYPADALIALRFEDFLAGDRGFEMLFEPAPRRVLQGFSFGATRLVLNILDRLRSRVEVLRPAEDGWRREALPGLPEEDSVGVFPLDVGLPRRDELCLSIEGFLTPPSLRLLRADGAIETLKSAPASFDASPFTVERREVVASDGERVPYAVVAPRDRTGPVPTILAGYGGFEVALTPSYLALTGAAWLARGGAYVLANLRGGGEFGKAWHRAGMREGKRRAQDDFAEIAADLVATGLTTPERLAARGGSNGGLLVGNMLTRYPERFGAIWCAVPLLDMRRFHKLLAGASWVAEYGDPDKPEDWAFLQAISPYQLLEAGRDYPPILITTSRRDDRVHPGHARKMAAKLEALGQRVLFFEPDEGGHGAANKDQQAELEALGLAFLRRSLSADEPCLRLPAEAGPPA
jgi:prolyl oligopeptidase